MRFKKLMLSLICIITLAFFPYTVSFADVGNSFSGDNGSSNSSGYTTNNDYGYSSNYYSYNNYNSTHSGSSGDVGWISFLVAGVLIVGGLISGVRGSTKNTYQPSNSANTQSATVVAPGNTEKEIIEKIQKVDPNFSETKFKAYAKKVWLSLQEAWESKNWESVRHLESEELYQLHNRQLKEYITLKKTNYLNMQNIRNVTITDFHEDGAIEILVVRLYASLLDYVMDDVTRKVIEGSDQNYVYRNYRLEFIRPKGTKTQNTAQTTHCPNCGALLNLSESGECEYCHSMVPSANSEWVLNLYAPW